MAKKKKLTGRGGAGRGQGKKPGAMGVKGTRSMGFAPDVLEFLATFTGKDGIPSASSVVEGLIRDSALFQSWSKKSAKSK